MGDGNSTLLQRNGESRETCVFCKAEIVDSQWFCRLPGKDGAILLCCPSCALRYFDRSRPEANGSEQQLNSYEHRFHLLVNGEQPWP